MTYSKRTNFNFARWNLWYDQSFFGMEKLLLDDITVERVYSMQIKDCKSDWLWQLLRNLETLSKGPINQLDRLFQNNANAEDTIAKNFHVIFIFEISNNERMIGSSLSRCFRWSTAITSSQISEGICHAIFSSRSIREVLRATYALAI